MMIPTGTEKDFQNLWNKLLRRKWFLMEVRGNTRYCLPHCPKGSRVGLAKEEDDFFYNEEDVRHYLLENPILEDEDEEGLELEPPHQREKKRNSRLSANLDLSLGLNNGSKYDGFDDDDDDDGEEEEEEEQQQQQQEQQPAAAEQEEIMYLLHDEG